MQIHVGGDGTLIALVNTSKYQSYVGEGWYEDNKLTSHLITEANKLNILAWGSGFECDWIVEFNDGISSKSGFREFTGFLDVQENAVHLINYDSLTMAAQFDDIQLPDKETSKYRVDIPSGLYKFRILQLVDTSQDGWWDVFENKPAFIIEYEPVSSGSNNMHEVPWFSL